MGFPVDYRTQTMLYVSHSMIGVFVLYTLTLVSS